MSDPQTRTLGRADLLGGKYYHQGQTSLRSDGQCSGDMWRCPNGDSRFLGESGNVLHLMQLFSSSQTVLNRGGGPDVSTGVGTVQVGWSQTGHLREGEEEEGEEGGRSEESVFSEASDRSSSIGPSVLWSLAW